MPRPIDHIDEQLVAALADDGRATNRMLAARVGLTETTVATRLRRLIDDRILRVTCVFDRQAAGYVWSVYMFLRIEGRDPRAVGLELARVPNIPSVALLWGSFDMVIHVIAADREHLDRTLTDYVFSVPGIVDHAIDLELDVVKYKWGETTPMPTGTIPLELPDPVVAIDDLDQSLINVLMEDGRQSNRSVGRQLGVSEGTVRTRIGRLEQSGLLRIVALHDPVAAMKAGVSALIGIVDDGHATRSIAEHIAKIPETIVCMTSVGLDRIHVMFETPDAMSLAELVTRVNGFPGVRHVDVRMVSDVVRYSPFWARLV